MQFRQNEKPVFPDQHIVKPDFAAAVFRHLYLYQISVSVGTVAVAGAAAEAAERQMNGAGDFFAKQRITAGAVDKWIENEGNFAGITGALIGVGYLFRSST